MWRPGQLLRARRLYRNSNGKEMTTPENAANHRPGVDAGWRVLFAFHHPWPRATHAERSASWTHRSIA
jgi:hypothetical protein